MKKVFSKIKSFSILTALLVVGNLYAQTESVVSSEAAVEIKRPIYEQLGMSSTVLASIMVTITILLVMFVGSLASSAKNVLEFKRNKIKGGAKFIALLVGMSVAYSASAAEVTSNPEASLIPFPDYAFWSFLTVDLILIGVIVYLTGIMKGVLSEYKVPSKLNLFARWNKSLTDAVPVSDEASILLDHDYDGIKELDNNLPPWWKYGFYVTILWGVIYVIYYNILNVGPLQEQEYLIEMEEGEKQMAEYRKLHPILITAENVTLLEDPASLSKGEKVFNDFCKTCHMDQGKGGAGPNLTDKNWIYGGDIKTVFTTISEGTNNGMAKWKETIQPDQIQFVASYILQLDYIAPEAGGKAPEGTVIVE